MINRYNKEKAIDFTRLTGYNENQGCFFKSGKIIMEAKVSDYKHALDESAIVVITDQKVIITHVNGNFCKISKYTADEFIGKNQRVINFW